MTSAAGGDASTTAGCASSVRRTGSDAGGIRPRRPAARGPVTGVVRARSRCGSLRRGARSSSRISRSSSVLGSIVSASGSAGKNLLLGPLVGLDDEEVDDEGHDEEGDQGGEERPDRRPAPGCQSSKLKSRPAGGLADRLEDDLGERGDDGGEGGADDERDGELDEVAAQDEVLETLHGWLLGPMWSMAALCVRGGAPLQPRGGAVGGAAAPRWLDRAGRRRRDAPGRRSAGTPRA